MVRIDCVVTHLMVNPVEDASRVPAGPDVRPAYSARIILETGGTLGHVRSLQALLESAGQRAVLVIEGDLAEADRP
jgi:hypothetical protein